MRTISAAALAKLAQQYGNEPITIIEVDWVSGRTASYADRTVGAIPGRILEVGDLDNVVAVSASNSSQSLDVTLDDTEGTIKTIFNGVDIHKRDARVYQYFAGLDLADKFLLFSGKISSPITWSERERTIRFTIISQLEDREVGFSAEEGQFPLLPADMVGKPWPMIFGTVRDCPALQVNHAITGTTLDGIGILAGVDLHNAVPLFSNGLNTDSGLGMTLAQISAQISTLWCGKYCWDRVDNARAAAILDQINDLYSQRSQAVSGSLQQSKCATYSRQSQVTEARNQGLGANPAHILGGEDFPQGTTLILEINGGLFTGYFSGSLFYIQSRYWPDGEEQAANEADDRDDPCPYDQGSGQVAPFDYRIDVPCGCGDVYNTCECRHYGFIVSTGGRGTTISDDPIIQQFWAEPGSTVRIYSGEPITYIVSIVPGTVLAVKAYKQFEGYRRLVNVPTDLYTVQNVTYGTIAAVQVVLNKPLSSIAEQGWGDDVYVTFQSSVGPNTIDIMKYLIAGWTDLTWDSTLFDYVRTKLTQFPMNFPILERKNTIDVLQEMAYQARCALWISNGVFYIKYLPEEPAVDDTVTVSDLDAESGVEVDLTRTEDLITKMKVKWRISWAPGETDQERDSSEKWMILRHNITRYGTHEEEYDWYCYNQPDIILKCATFWLIRKSCTWKKIRFKTFLNKLDLETFDCVNLNFSGGYVANEAVKAIVLQANYDSDANLIDFDCLVPVKAGEMEKSRYYWPSTLRVDETWPSQADINTGDAGGGGVGQGATGELPIGYIDGIESGGIVWVGGPNIAFRAHSDYGDPIITDQGFTPQIVINPSIYGELAHAPKPRLHLRLHLANPSPSANLPPLKGGISIDIAKTVIIDSREQNGRSAKFTSIFRGINESNRLLIKTDALVADTDHPEGAEFDFKYDSEQSVYGAGTAFLQD